MCVLGHIFSFVFLSFAKLMVNHRLLHTFFMFQACDSAAATSPSPGGLLSSAGNFSCYSSMTEPDWPLPGRMRASSPSLQQRATSQAEIPKGHVCKPRRSSVFLRDPGFYLGHQEPPSRPLPGSRVRWPARLRCASSAIHIAVSRSGLRLSVGRLLTHIGIGSICWQQ